MKKLFVLLMAAVLLISNVPTVNAASAESKELSKKISTATLYGKSSFTSHRGTAYSVMSQPSYTTVTSVYKYINGSDKVKTAPSDLTGGGGSQTATWSYNLSGSCYSASIKSVHYGKINSVYDSFTTTAK